MENSKFMNGAFVRGEVREVELQDLGGRKDNRCRVNVYTEQGFVNVQLNNPRKANEEGRNYAEKLFNKLNKGDIVEINGSLEEFYYNEQYRRNVSPFLSTKDGWRDNIKVLADNQDKLTANARVAGDVIEKEISYDDEGNMQIDFTVLYYNNWNRETGNNDLSRKEVVANSIENFGNYSQTNEKDINFDKLSNLKDSLAQLNKDDYQGITNIYRDFKETFNPLMFNLNEYHITATGDIAEEMEEVEEFDNITTGIYLVNNVVIDEFGLAQGSKNLLEVGKYYGINESLASGGEELAEDFDQSWG